MGLLLRHKLLIGATTIVAAASAGGAYAATNSSGNPRQALINDVAKRLHVSPSQLTSALKAALIDRLNAAVSAGQITRAQANRLEQRIEQNNRLPLFFGPPRLRAHLLARRGILDAAASYLGLTDTQLMSDLRSGQSLAQIANSRGKSVSGLEQALFNAEKARLNQLESRGLITSAQEQKLLSRLSARIARLINRTRMAPPMPAGANRPLLAPAPPGPPGGPPPYA